MRRVVGVAVAVAARWLAAGCGASNNLNLILWLMPCLTIIAISRASAIEASEVAQQYLHQSLSSRAQKIMSISRLTTRRRIIVAAVRGECASARVRQLASSLSEQSGQCGLCGKLASPKLAASECAPRTRLTIVRRNVRVTLRAVPIFQLCHWGATR